MSQCSHGLFIYSTAFLIFSAFILFPGHFQFLLLRVSHIHLDLSVQN
nr:MAG TPA: hypothetical protein [Caudoviricetes sp.]